ncbi:protein ENHANCED DISEASE RESISTANCE 2 isoform X1 [Rhododendron vialii]|uniref:protein ENHANCED DISEASE RESISTANCE 2 isoform X1 n=2 Tax=Rhododendron vialii TaxID=182163 RepID=UPI00265DC78D|nr:protein ENHANCED DISEASE RESISTANCE 2 isoform X1 [Rhododendron vialii]
MAVAPLKANGSAAGGSPPQEGVSETGAFGGWVYHLGVNSIGREYCHLRYLLIRGKYVEMYKRDPRENPGIKPIRRGVVGHTLVVEELGRRKVNDGDLYVLRFRNRLDESKKGEIACAKVGDARKWIEAFDHAKQQAEYELSRGASARNKLNMETEINLEHQPRVRRVAHGLRNLINIGQGPESLLRKSSNLGRTVGLDGYLHGDGGDVIEAHEWKCVRTVNGIRIFEDVAKSKNGKAVLVKAVGVVDASADVVFEVFMNVDRHQRYEWDMLTGDLELVESLDGHFDVLYGTYEPRHLTRWHSRRDFVFSRQWFRAQDGTYTILHFPTGHKKCPSKPGYRRTEINPSTWEIRSLNITHSPHGARCLVMQMVEIQPVGGCWGKNNEWSKFEKTVSYAFLSQVAGLKEYIGANPSLASEFLTTSLRSKFFDVSSSNSDHEDANGADEFYDAISADSSSDDDDSDNGEQFNGKDKKVKLKNISWAIASLALKHTPGPDLNQELDSRVPPIVLDPRHYHGSFRQGKDETDSNCWTSPSGAAFMIRGKTYLKDNTKVKGGDPLLQLIAVDWFKVENCISKVALHPSSLVQSEAGKKLPFVLIVNLEVPARPNYSLVLYYAADRPVNKNSLLGKFIDGSDMFRDSRLKLIPSIVEGYWMVKRAVGTKACLLGKAVTCKYLRQDNFLEIDVDIGSSSVARGVISLVLGYVTSLVVDLAILIEAKEEAELPEYILGTVRLNRVKLDSAVPLEV